MPHVRLAFTVGKDRIRGYLGMHSRLWDSRQQMFRGRRGSKARESSDSSERGFSGDRILS